ncbi:MAG: redoxin [Alteromonadaceae bacterium]|nr:redoxin [Alteromonadaceae bacterium]|tara:strand:+ start:1853 stop:2323 length:471 start_codon:yes stop_codon:yes gene_type:complete
MTRRRLPRSLALLALILLLSACGKDKPVSLASGDTLDWADLEGQWLAVNYWAEWCKPCYEEIPELNALDRDPAVTVLGVNYDALEGDELNAVIRKMGINFPNLIHSPAPRFGWNHPVGLPATFLVNPAGEVVEARFGPQTRNELLTVIQASSEGWE